MPVSRKKAAGPSRRPPRKSATPEPEVEIEVDLPTPEPATEAVEAEATEPEAPAPAKAAPVKKAAKAAASPKKEAFPTSPPSGKEPWQVAVSGVLRLEDENGPVWFVAEGEVETEGYPDKDAAEAAYKAKVTKLLPKKQAQRFKQSTIVMWCHLLNEGGVSVRDICAGGFDDDAWAIEAEQDFRLPEFAAEIFGLNRPSGGRRSKKASKKDQTHGAIVPKAKKKNGPSQPKSA
jgi:hypothetical protein